MAKATSPVVGLVTASLALLMMGATICSALTLCSGSSLIAWGAVSAGVGLVRVTWSLSRENSLKKNCSEGGVVRAVARRRRRRWWRGGGRGEDEDGEEGEECFVGEGGGLAEGAGVVDFVVEDFGEEPCAGPPGVGDEVAFALGFFLEGVGDRGLGGDGGHGGIIQGMRIFDF